MNIEDLFIEKISTNENFDYKILYNDSRGAVHKDEYKSLIRQAIEKRVIIIDTFIVAENVQEELYTISEIKGFEYNLINCLKTYHNEADSRVAPLIYLLKKLDPSFTLNDTEGKLQIISDLFEAELCPRIDGKNAEPRIFFPKEKVAITSTNDDIENLGDILAVKNVKVYALGTDDRSNIIYAYKVSRDESFFDVAEGYKENLRSNLFDDIRK